MEDDLSSADPRIESDADSLLPGSKLHGYRIDSVLGQGDHWFTYLASDPNLNRAVIITEYMPCEIAIRDTRGVIHPAAPERGAEYKAGLECFLADARKLAGIRHRNIAQALNAFEANNSAYIVVAHQQGKKAEHLFDGSTMTEKELLAFVLPILDGLEAIHASGCIHRHIQPSNIIIRADGSRVLTGFKPGARALFKPANTLTKHFPSGFAPIELCFGDSELYGPWTDIFSLGAMLYQAVVGIAPVDAIERSRTIVQAGTDPLMSVLPVGQGNYSDAFLKAIDHALGFLPTQRPLSVAAWRNELSGKDPLGIAFVIRSAQARFDEATEMAPKSDAVARLRDELKAPESAVVQERLLEETRHLQAEETGKVVAPGYRGKWLGYSAAMTGIVSLGLSLAWMPPGTFAILYDAADEWLSGNLFDDGTEAAPKPVGQVPVPERRAPNNEAAEIVPESEAVGSSLRDDLTARQSRQVSIREVTPSRVHVRTGETVRFYTEYSLSLPANDKEAHVKATWVLLRDGRKIGREGIDNRYARAGLNTAVTELTLPLRTASGQYTVEHRVRVGDSFDVAHSRFVLTR